MSGGGGPAWDRGSLHVGAQPVQEARVVWGPVQTRVRPTVCRSSGGRRWVSAAVGSRQREEWGSRDSA